MPAEGLEWVSGDACTPDGFKAWALPRSNESGLSFALLWSECPAVFSGQFTTSAAKAAPIVVTQGVHRRGVSQALVVNAGNANAMTGGRGLDDARAMQRQMAEELHLAPERVAVASTGVIGVYMDMAATQEALAELGKRARHGKASQAQAAAEAILTTDTRPKTAALRIALSGGSVCLGMMAKGSGMIHPDMATMLAFFTTDAVIPKAELDGMVRRAVERSFHRLTVDGDTSTNDMVLVWANGVSGVGPATGADYHRFEAGLTALAQAAARMIAADGEGATHLLTACVAGAVSEADAALKARAIVGSSLVKAAVYGQDPNWGRVLAALGRVGHPFIPESLSLRLGEVMLFAQGQPVEFDEAAAKRELSRHEVIFWVDLGQGTGVAEAWGCDLTEGYVDINAHYRS